jgi:hypothetical protein
MGATLPRELRILAVKLKRSELTQKQMQTKAEYSASHPPPRSGLVQLLREPPYAAPNASRLISCGGFHNKIKIGCNIHQVPQVVNVDLPPNAAGDGGLSL